MLFVGGAGGKANPKTWDKDSTPCLASSLRELSGRRSQHHWRERERGHELSFLEGLVPFP